MNLPEQLSTSELNVACENAVNRAWTENSKRAIACKIDYESFRNIYRVAWWTGGVYASERAEPPFTQLLVAAEKLVALMDEVPNDMPGGEADRVFPHYEFDELREALAVANGKSPSKFASDGMAWWNALPEPERRKALEEVGPDASIADAYRAHLVNVKEVRTREAIKSALQAIRREIVLGKPLTTEEWQQLGGVLTKAINETRGSYGI